MIGYSYDYMKNNKVEKAACYTAFQWRCVSFVSEQGGNIMFSL